MSELDLIQTLSDEEIQAIETAASCTAPRQCRFLAVFVQKGVF